MWRVARIIQVDSDSVKVQLFERFSDRAKAIATRGLSTEYVSEVSLSSIEKTPAHQLI